MQQKLIYYKSDFKLFIRTDAGFFVPFRFEFYTDKPNRPFVAKYDGTTYSNCFLLEDGRLCVAVENACFGFGKLMIKQTYFLNDPDYPEKVCDRVIDPRPVIDLSNPDNPCEIFMGPEGDDAIEFTVELPPYMQFVVTRELYDGLVQATEHAETAADNADSKAALADEKASLANEQAAIAGEKAALADEKAALANDKAELANEKAELCEQKTAQMVDKFDKISSDLQAAYSSTSAQLAQDYAAAKGALEADYETKKGALESDYHARTAELSDDYTRTKAALSSDYDNTKAVLANEYSTKLSALTEEYRQKQAALDASYAADMKSLNDRMAAIESDYSETSSRLSEDYAAAKRELASDYEAKKSSLASDYASTKSYLASDYNNTKSSLSSDYDNTKAAIAIDYAAKYSSLEEEYRQKQAALDAAYAADMKKLNDRMAAIEAQYATDKTAWQKETTDFIEECRTTFSSNENQRQHTANEQRAAENAVFLSKEAERDAAISSVTDMQPKVAALDVDVASLKSSVGNMINTPVDDSELPTLCGQPPILFGEGSPQESVVPSNWRQFDPITGDGYNWNGEPSAIGQQYIDVTATAGGRYIAIPSSDNVLTWKNV